MADLLKLRVEAAHASASVAVGSVVMHPAYVYWRVQFVASPVKDAEHVSLTLWPLDGHDREVQRAHAERRIVELPVGEVIG